MDIESNATKCPQRNIEGKFSSWKKSGVAATEWVGPHCYLTWTMMDLEMFLLLMG